MSNSNLASPSDSKISTDRSTQDGQLTSSAGQLSLQNAEKAFNDSAQVTNSLLNSNATNNNDPEFDPLPLRTSEKSQQVVVIPVEGGDAPPPYVTESPSSSPAGNDAPAGSSGNAGPFALFAKSVKAFASQLVSKPDPLVSALCQAINHGDVQQARGLLAQRPNVNGRNEEGNTPMHYAITSNNEDMLRLLLAAGASSKGSGWTALPALFQAASTGKLGIAKVLLENGADINEKSITGQPYFVDVLDGGNISGIEFLLKEGASSTTESPSGRSVLVQAVKKDNLEIVTLLLKYGANISASDITGSSLLAIAAEKKDLSMTKLLLEHGVNPNSTNLYGGSVLADAIWGGRVELAKLLLDRGANGDESFWSGTSLLVKTITSTKVRASDKTDLVRRLLQNGASVNNPWDGNAAVCKALEVPSAPSTIVELLLQHGTKPNEHRMSSGETLLLYAMDKGKKLEARALLRHGADPNASDEKGRTPLMQALVTQDLEMVKLLRQHRADVNVKATASVADIAKLVNRPDMLEVLGMAESG